MTIDEKHNTYFENELSTAKNRLLERIEFWLGHTEGDAQAIPGLWMYKFEEPSDRISVIQYPSVCLIGQGSKQIFLGKETLHYDRDHYLVTSIDLPVVAQVQDASPDKPYVGMAFTIQQKEIAQLLAEGNLPLPAHYKAQRAMTVGTLSLPLLNAFLRLIDLLNDPVSIPFLAPSISREILYRLITSEEGFHLRQVGMTDTRSAQIYRAVDWLKNNYQHPLRIEKLSSYCNMSKSTFHYHFRELTSMSPLQYQKWLRLQEARRLMLSEDFDVTRAAFKVGYAGTSQFCREYSRQYGESPAKDIRTIKDARLAGG